MAASSSGFAELLRRQSENLKPSETVVTQFTSLFGAAGSDEPEHEEEKDEFASREEQLREMMFNAKRARSGQTMKCQGPEGSTHVTRVAVFLYDGKRQQHPKFDMFAYLLCGTPTAEEECEKDGRGFELQQVDVGDLRAGRLTTRNFDLVVVPGGPICDVEKALGKAGSKALLAFVSSGGGYFGACAGAFLASRRGYVGAAEKYALIPSPTGWVPGVGVATVEVLDSEVARQVLGDDLGGKQLRLHWANGSCHDVPVRREKVVLHPLCRFKEVSTNTNQEKFDGAHPPPPYAAVAGACGAGRVVVFGPHPEASGTVGARIVRTALLWISSK